MVSQGTCRKAYLITLLTTITVGVVIVGGCGVTQQANFWMDPSYNAAPMKKILVIAMRKDQVRRRMWEDAIVAALNGKEHAGTTAVPSYQLFANDIPAPDTVGSRTKEEGFDGVLIVSPVKRDTLTNELPGYKTSEAVTTYDRKWDTYVTRYEDVYHPGRVDTETTVSVRTDLLLPEGDGKLVWSVTSQSVDPASADQFRSSVAAGVASQLKKNLLIY